jgi:hypothetical protein
MVASWKCATNDFYEPLLDAASLLWSEDDDRQLANFGARCGLRQLRGVQNWRILIR